MPGEFVARQGLISRGNVVVTGSLTTSGSLTATGTITATTLVVQTVTSSISSITGSTNFGSLSSNTHTFTGSLLVNGPTGSSVFTAASTDDTRILITDSGNASTIMLRSDGSNTSFGTITDHSLSINTNNLSRIYINNSGSVSIGTGSVSYAKFNVYNNTNDATYNSKIQAVFGNADYQDSDAIQNYGSGLSETQFLVGSTTRPSMISMGGNIAAGEAVGVINFFRSTNTDTYRSRAWIWSAITSTGTANQHGGILAFSTANDGQTNPQERMRITAAGTTQFASPTNGQIIYAGDTSKTGYIYQQWQNAGGSCYFGIERNTGGGLFNNTSAYALAFGTTNATDVSISSNGTERMRITSGGSVLYGTTTSSTAALFTAKSSTTATTWGFGPNIINSTDIFRIETLATTGVYLTSGNTSWTANSDERLKDITENIENAVDALNTLRTVKFSWKKDENNKINLGLIAQDVIKVLPEVVDINDDEDKTLGVKYTELIPVLVKAIQELKSQNDSLQSQINELKA